MAGVAAALLALVHKHPWLTGLLIAAVVIFGAIATAALASYGRSWLKDTHSKSAPEPETAETIRRPGQPFTARWRYITDGAAAVSTSWSFNKSVSHSGHSQRQSQEMPPKVITSFLVPCAPFEEQTPTSTVVDAFIDLLSGSVIGKLTSMLTHVEGGLSWYSYSTNGALNNQAILARSYDDPEAPVATAILNLNDSSPKIQHFQDPERAELIVTVEVRSGDGSKPEALTFAEWQAWLVQLLKVPDAFAHTLLEDVRTPTYDSPDVRVGVWLEGHSDLADLVDPGPVAPSGGSQAARTFPVYLLGDPAGKTAPAVAIDALRGICDYGLHIHGYEAQLEALRSGETP